MPANNNVADVTFDVTRSGYTALGVIGFRLGAGGECSTVSVQLAINTVTYRIMNNGTYTATVGDVNINVLYAKNV